MNMNNSKNWYRFSNLSDKQRVAIWLGVLLLFVMIIFATYYLPRSFNVSEGDISPSTIEANQTVTYENTVATEAKRAQAMEKVGDIYVFDTSRLNEMIAQIDQIFNEWINYSTLEADNQLMAITEASQSLNIELSVAKYMVKLDESALNVVKTETENILSDVWLKGVTSQEVESALKTVVENANQRISDNNIATFVTAIYNKINLEPNYIYDEASTNRAKQEASANVEPELYTIYRNQKVIGKGEIVTAEHIEMLKALGYQQSSEPYIMVLGSGLLTLGLAYLMYIFVKLFNTHRKFDTRVDLPVIVIIGIANLAIARALIFIDISNEYAVSEMIRYIVPVAAGSIMIRFLQNRAMGVFYALSMSIYTGLLSGGSLYAFAVAMAGSVTGIYCIDKLSSRKDWSKAGLMIGIVNTWFIISFGIIAKSDITTVLYGVAMGLINATISPVIAYGSLPFIESAFDISTSVSLLELSNPRQPLLKELLIKAPGTYQHSIMVASLAESAASAVGADPILTRVGAYYHDIGKLKRPYFFAENQHGGENPHDKLSPNMSAMILASHVKEGVEMAKVNNLPEDVTAFIREHHGTGLMSYFYHKACEEAPEGTIVKESDYRYPGPKPSRKEVAVVMLADSVEAAVRSIRSNNPTMAAAEFETKMEATIDKIIKDKLDDGQLEDSDLTFTDLKRIKKDFLTSLHGIYHSRVEYPKNVLEELEKRKQNETISE